MKRCRVIFGALCLSTCICVFIIISEFRRDIEIKEFYVGNAIDRFKRLKNQACVHPDLSLWKDFDIKSVINENVTCGDAKKEWVYTGNGRFYISSSAVKRHEAINCTYIPIRNFKDDYERLKPIYSMRNKTKLLTDAFQVLCKSASGEKYENYHACISVNAKSNVNQKKMPNATQFNVMILGLDSFSRLMFQRLLPKTHEFFTKILGGSILEGHNIVGDGTTRNIMPLFTGTRYHEVPETHKGFPGAKHVDEVLDFVWKKYENKAYVTQWAEDYPRIGIFVYMTRGFLKQPVTHYMRPFYLAVRSVERKGYCIGERSSYKVYLDWLKEGLETNKRKPFFTFGINARFSHNGYLQMPKVDKYNVDFLKYLDHKNILQNTFLFLFSDHGRRYGKFRMTEQGKLEERQPYCGLFVPPKFRSKFPQKYRIFLENTNRLTTPLDIHETLLDIIGEGGNYTNSRKASYSLFTPIPQERTCLDAGIDSHWCACLMSESISVSDPRVTLCVQHAVSYINGRLKPFYLLCHQLSSKNILKAVTFKTDSSVLKFKHVWRDKVYLSDKLKSEIIHFQITFVTEPSDAIFEASIIMDLKTSDIKVNGDSISRLNMYGDAPKCVEIFRPDLRPYCYCRF